MSAQIVAAQRSPANKVAEHFIIDQTVMLKNAIANYKTKQEKVSYYNVCF